MSLIKRLLFKPSGNFLVQKLLEGNIQFSQYLMGIGRGGNVFSSGERAVFRILKKRIQPPYCVFDVGSNKGQYLQLILDSIPLENLTVHCFEPGRHTYKILSESLPKDSRITLNNFGLGETKSETVLHYNEKGSGLASLTKRRLDHHGIDFNESEPVLINTIDDYCSDNGVNHINLLKIDIEGHELDALAGAKNMFESKSIDIATFEFGGCNIDTRTYFQDFWYFFEDAGFKMFRITPSGYFYPLHSYKERYEQFSTINFAAVSRSLLKDSKS